jgi:hypothetical protein
VTVLLIVSSSGAGWQWTAEHSRDFWTYNQSVLEGQIDGVQTYYCDDGEGCNVQADARTGGPNHVYPEEIDIYTGGYLIFHSKINYYFYWGEDPEERPEGCVALYASISLELWKWNGVNYAAVGGTTGSHTLNVESSETVGPVEKWLHVWEDSPHMTPGTQYRLYIYTIGGWIDNEEVKHPDPEDGESTMVYYKVVP